MWKDISLKFNQSLIESSGNSYPLKAYFLSQFAHAKDVKTFELSYEELMYNDDPSMFDVTMIKGYTGLDTKSLDVLIRKF